MLTTVLTAAEESGVVNHLPIHPIAYGAVTFVVLTALLVVTYAFRSVWTRH